MTEVFSEICNVGVVGPNGFIGANLVKDSGAKVVYGRTDGELLASSNHDLLICSGAPAEKWKANSHPEEDAKNLKSLVMNLSTAKANNFVLISTIDVLGNGKNVIERQDISSFDRDAYGFNRYELEVQVASMFSQSLIIRLPGMYGPGIKKNLIYDLLHSRELPNLNYSSTFQWFDVRDIWPILLLALRENLDVLHLATEPISARDLVARLEPSRLSEVPNTDLQLKDYSMKTEFSTLISGREGPFLKSKEEVLTQIQIWYEAEKAKIR